MKITHSAQAHFLSLHHHRKKKKKKEEDLDKIMTAPRHDSTASMLRDDRTSLLSSSAALSSKLIDPVFGKNDKLQLQQQKQLQHHEQEAMATDISYATDEAKKKEWCPSHPRPRPTVSKKEEEDKMTLSASSETTTPKSCYRHDSTASMLRDDRTSLSSSSAAQSSKLIDPVFGKNDELQLQHQKMNTSGTYYFVVEQDTKKENQCLSHRRPYSIDTATGKSMRCHWRSLPLLITAISVVAIFSTASAQFNGITNIKKRIVNVVKTDGQNIINQHGREDTTMGGHQERR